MGETYWPADPQNLNLPTNTIYAQTFSPLWSHDLETIRYYLKYTPSRAKVKISIQYLKPDGTPTGSDLASVTDEWEHIPYGAYTNTRQSKVNRIRLTAGINYAFLMETLYRLPTYPIYTYYKPFPSAYPRGKLIKSIDGGSTWDTHDLGDLYFGEFGDPPVKPTPYNPPIQHWAITDLTQLSYLTSSCIRVATTEPCFLTAHFSREKPSEIQTWKVQRGSRIKCLDHFKFKSIKTYRQKEDYDSLYHTFYITALQPGDLFYLTFTADTALAPTISNSNIFYIVQSAGPPFSTIRRPNAPGDVCNIPYEVGAPCPDHYKNVDEATPDEDTTQIYTGEPYASSWMYDLYHIKDLLPHGRPIQKVRITMRCKRVGGFAYAAYARIYLRASGVTWPGRTYRGWSTSWTDLPIDYLYNPTTGLAWTVDEVNDLQFGPGLWFYRGVGWSTRTHCTQIYARIYYDCSAYN